MTVYKFKINFTNQGGSDSLWVKHESVWEALSHFKNTYGPLPVIGGEVLDGPIEGLPEIEIREDLLNGSTH